MAGYGASVMVADRNMAAARETVQAILDMGGTAVAQFCDVAEEAQVAEMIEWFERSSHTA